MLSDANTNEVYLHWGSKFINGALDFFSGRFGLSIASALEIYNIFTDDGISNKEQRYSDDAKSAATGALLSLETDALNTILKIIAPRVGPFPLPQGEGTVNYVFFVPALRRLSKSLISLFTLSSANISSRVVDNLRRQFLY